MSWLDEHEQDLGYPDDAVGVHPIRDVILDPAEEAHEIYMNEGFESIFPKILQKVAVDAWIYEHGTMYTKETLEELRFLALY